MKPTNILNFNHCWEFREWLEIITSLKKDSGVWKNFLNFLDLYKRIKISNIQKERKNEETFKKKLDHFIKNTKSERLPETGMIMQVSISI